MFANIVHICKIDFHCFLCFKLCFNRNLRVFILNFCHHLSSFNRAELQMTDDSFTSPFEEKNWSFFGFSSTTNQQNEWFKIQDELIFIGAIDSITECCIYCNIKSTNIFLVKKKGTKDTIWNISNCEFKNCEESIDCLNVFCNHRMIQLWNVSQSLVDILVHERKLDSSSLVNITNNKIYSEYE